MSDLPPIDAVTEALVADVGLPSVIAEPAAGVYHPLGSRLSGLRAEVRALQAEYDSLATQRQRLETLALEEATVLEEVRALGEREVATLAAWAKDGQGDAPAAFAEERERLVRQLASVRAMAAAASGSIAELEDSQKELAGRLTAAMADLESAALGQLESEAAQIRSIIDRQAGELAHSLSGLGGLRMFLSEHGRAHASNGGNAFLGLCERIAGINPSAAVPSDMAIADAAAWWQGHFEELKNGQ